MKPYLKRAWAEISLSAFAQNIETIKAALQPDTEMMAVVKADAYGHGEAEMIHTLADHGVRYFAVSNLDEAIRVRQHCQDGEILILGYTPPEYADELAANRIIQGIVSTEYANALVTTTGERVRCHIKLDTGMGRIGLCCDSIDQCASQVAALCSSPNLSVEGLYTHFAVADCDAPNEIAYTNGQRNKILAVNAALQKMGIHLRHVHYLNSAGLLYHNDQQSTLARIGIILYGLYPNYPQPMPLTLTPVLELKAVISHVKTVQPGDSISYGRTFVADKQMKIATVTVGYADGYSRLLSSKAEVLVQGKRCKIVGRICMDQLMLDVSALSSVSAGEIVTLIGRDGDDYISADELAALYGTIGYEIVCGISKRVPRIYK